MMRILLLIIACFLYPDEHRWIEKAVEREFAQYQKTGIRRDQIEHSWTSLRKKPEFRRYKIIGSKVYGQEGRIKNLLELLIAKSPIPDIDFIYFYEDRIKKKSVQSHPEKYAAPIFVSAKDASLSQLILFSDWLYDAKNEEGGWNLILRNINGAQDQWPWSKKIDKLFWRGSPFDGKHFGMYTFDNWTTLPRGYLVYQSRKHPESIDAAFSTYPDRCIAENPARCLQEMGRASFVPPEEQLQYKYQILIDGVTCTFPGTHWKLLSGSTIFKQDSPDILYFYPELTAWKHYIPVRSDLSDLLAKIHWAQSHDAEAREMARNAREFALTHLMPEHILAYCRAILLRYASLQTFQPTLEPWDPTDSGRQF